MSETILKNITKYLATVMAENFEEDIVDQFNILVKDKKSDILSIINSATAKPKRNKTAYQMFCANKKLEDKTLKITDIRSMWNDTKTDKDELEKYQKMADEENGVDSKVSGPKRARSAYIFFSQDFRQKVKEDNPGIEAKHVMTELGKLWTAMKESDEPEHQEIVEKYTSMAEEDKERYKTEMENLPEDFKTTKSVKRGKSAYNFYCTENRKQVKEENPDSDAKEITSILSEMWKQIKAEKGEEYEKYMDMQKEERERVANMSESEDKNKGIKRVNPYTLFCKKNRDSVKADNPEISSTDINKMLAEMWKELKSDKDRSDELAEYEEEAASINKSNGVDKKVKSTVGKTTSGKITSAKKTSAKPTRSKTTASKSTVGKKTVAKVTTSKKTIPKETIISEEEKSEAEDNNEDNNEEDNEDILSNEEVDSEEEMPIVAISSTAKSITGKKTAAKSTTSKITMSKLTSIAKKK